MNDNAHARFASLHQQGRVLLLPNAWDAASARLWQEAGATAVATTSAAVAWSRGYADGGSLPRAELLDSLRGMVRVASIPVTADVEDGYSDDPGDVAAFVAEVADAGAVGINLEDGGADPALLAAKIAAIRATLGARPLFINARTDVYLHGMATGREAVAMTIERLDAYRQAGADGGFVPGLASAEEATGIAVALPGLAINLMAMPGLPPVETFAAAGVQRISAGPAFFKAAFGAGDIAVRAWLGGDFAPSFANALDYAHLNRMFSPD